MLEASARSFFAAALTQPLATEWQAKNAAVNSSAPVTVSQIVGMNISNNPASASTIETVSTRP